MSSISLNVLASRAAADLSSATDKLDLVIGLSSWTSTFRVNLDIITRSSRGALTFTLVQRDCL